MRRLALLALCPLLALATAAAAADAVFPPGSRIGLVPPPGMAVSKRFVGFESPRGAAITIVEMPAAAAGQALATLTPEGLQSQNIALKAREDLKLGDAPAVLVSGEQQAGPMTVRKWILLASEPSLTALVIAQAVGGDDAYSDAEIRDALKSVAVRQPLSMDDQLASLPFRVGDRAGLKPVRTAGASLLLTDRGEPGGVETGQAVMVVAQSGDIGASPDQRDAFAAAMLRSNVTLKEMIFERAQGFRQRGAEWHEIVARAKDAGSGKPVIVMQTIRWDRGSFLRMLGIAPEEARDDILSRFRALADSVSPEG
jgi:hypothetical protein